MTTTFTPGPVIAIEGERPGHDDIIAYEPSAFVLMPRRATRQMIDAADACVDAYEAYAAMVEVGRVR